MTDEQLYSLQKQLATEYGYKVDIYHSEMHRGILVVPHGMQLHPQNVITSIKY